MKKLLTVQSLKKYFPIYGGLLSRVVGQVKAVDDVSFDIYEGEILGLVGESGCGKTTVGRMTLRLMEPTSGNVYFEDADIFALNRKELAKFRPKMQIIFQDPLASLNPRKLIRKILEEPFDIHGFSESKEKEDRVSSLLKRVGLTPDQAEKYPHEFSGGQLQRVGIARAIAMNPSLIIADEPVSALDVSIQAQVINLMEDLREEFNLSYVFISHDLSIVEHVCDRIAVMYLGVIVEVAAAEGFSRTPCHPYTEALVSSVPIPDPHRKTELFTMEGDVPNPIDPPAGCRFHPRCRY